MTSTQIIFNISNVIGLIFMCIGGLYLSIQIVALLMNRVYLHLQVGTAFIEFLIDRQKKSHAVEIKAMEEKKVRLEALLKTTKEKESPLEALLKKAVDDDEKKQEVGP